MFFFMQFVFCFGFLGRRMVQQCHNLSFPQEYPFRFIKANGQGSCFLWDAEQQAEI